MRLLLDTHIWIHFLSGSKELPRKIHVLLDSGKHSIWLSPISIWETLMLAEKKRLQLEPNPERWIQEALEAYPVQDAALNRAVALKSHQIQLPHRDPADHFIAATAHIYDLTLVTLDRHLLVADDVPTLH